MPRTLNTSRRVAPSGPAPRKSLLDKKHPADSDSDVDVERKAKAVKQDEKKEVLPDTQPLTLAVLVARAYSSEVDDGELCLEFGSRGGNWRNHPPIVVNGKTVSRVRLALKVGWCGFRVFDDEEQDPDDHQLVSARFNLDNCHVTVDSDQ